VFLTTVSSPTPLAGSLAVPLVTIDLALPQIFLR
jgi:hypothetical protein